MAATQTTALFKFEKGATFSRLFGYAVKVFDDEGNLLRKDAIDLTGKTVVFHFHENGSTTDILTLTSGDEPTDKGSVLIVREPVDDDEFPDITRESGVMFVIDMKITDEDTDTFTDDLGGKWWMGLDDNGDIRPIGQGPVKVLEL